ncbi:hypothetical protein LTR62_006616 [Meristemomyces frigidus]|uniref:ASST-domain-containing protein n=1 Tax=Meristemomyces frigidus TaxID=1508187 RepID=A0AAN7TH74_9PEZI|nr:hypothetical protein LTR62_006616 [Meristemomyces frigidus]
MSSPLHRTSLLLTTVLCSFLPACLAHDEAFQLNDDYNRGALGAYVTQKYITTDLDVPKLNFMKPFTACDDGSYLFLAPRGEEASTAVCILDATGALVWATNEYHGQAYNLQAQTYRGERYLTFWAGDNSIGGHGVGQYYMLDHHYHLYRTIVAADSLPTDLHAFTITADGTALLSVYQVQRADLSTTPRYAQQLRGGAPVGGRPSLGRPELQKGPADGRIWESMFQEIDIETGALLFQWSARDHFPFDASFQPITSATEEESWDWFHINSVEKDDNGNYLISARHLRTIACIDGRTGDVLWQLGGTNNSFEDKSYGFATKFIGQHDAHWVPGSNYTSVSLFDNRADWTFHTETRSMGVRIELDFAAMTATRVQRYLHDPSVYSVSQGSYQTLPNGNVVLGYGNNGVITEFAPDGTVLCDAYFEPSKRWTSGDVQSYRNLKFNWTGLPTTQPKVAMQDGKLYISWLGSTETTNWLIQHSSFENSTFRELMKVPKDGFETAVGLNAGIAVRRYLQATALDSHGRPLSISDPVDIGTVATVFAHEPLGNGTLSSSEDQYDDLEDAEEADGLAELDDTFDDMQVLLGWMILASISTLLVISVCRGIQRRRVASTYSSVAAEYTGKRSDDLGYRDRIRLVWADPKALWKRLAGKRVGGYRLLGQGFGGGGGGGEYEARGREGR